MTINLKVGIIDDHRAPAYCFSCFSLLLLAVTDSGPQITMMNAHLKELWKCPTQSLL